MAAPLVALPPSPDAPPLQWYRGCVRPIARRVRRAVLQAMILTAGFPLVAHAQAAAGPNSGALTFTGGLDFPTVYVFRGIVRETDPKLTMFPYGEIGIRLASGSGAVKSVAANVGVWNSLQTGSSGSDGFTEHLHYEEDFYATLSLGFSKNLSLGTTYTAYTSPNLMFDTVKEIGFNVAQSSWIHPYGVLAFEVGEHGIDGGQNNGTYLELGAAPAFPFRKATLSVPVKLGMSLANYYELNGVDHKFGFFDVGGLITMPLSGSSSKFGSWNIHGGVDFLAFGDTTKYFNQDDSSKVVGLVGIGVKY